MEAPKEPFLEEAERCWKEGEGQSHLPVWWGEEKTGIGCLSGAKDGKCSHVPKVC